MFRIVALIELALCWIAWVLAFRKPRQQAVGQKEAVRVPASRWGIVLEGIGFFCVWFQLHPIGFQKSAPSLVASMILGPPAVALVWAATRHLGKQWRYQAGLNVDHDLVQTGPYARLRHPIYASMFTMLLTTGFALAWWPMFILGVIFFLIGTEIRVHAEERLLAEHFRAIFRSYRARTSAYIPFLR
jgi:protein-S-isoprenylcysteine O-methyltransferase Ste14